MRQRFRNSVRQQFSRTLALLAPLLLLAACGGYRSADFNPIYENSPWSETDPTRQERKLALSDFSASVVRFTDDRRPKSREARISDRLIYEYEPDELMDGIKYHFPVLIEKYACYRPKMARDYKLEVELKRLQTVIKTGTLLSGSYGRYSVNMEMAVVVRRADSSVVMQRHYRYEIEEPRKAYDGRGPSLELDRAKMYELVEQGVREMSANLGWDIYTGDARIWRSEQAKKPAAKPVVTPVIVPAEPVELLPEVSPTEPMMIAPSPQG